MIRQIITGRRRAAGWAGRKPVRGRANLRRHAEPLLRLRLMDKRIGGQAVALLLLLLQRRIRRRVGIRRLLLLRVVLSRRMRSGSIVRLRGVAIGRLHGLPRRELLRLL